MGILEGISSISMVGLGAPLMLVGLILVGGAGCTQRVVFPFVADPGPDTGPETDCSEPSVCSEPDAGPPVDAGRVRILDAGVDGGRTEILPDAGHPPEPLSLTLEGILVQPTETGTLVVARVLEIGAQEATTSMPEGMVRWEFLSDVRPGPGSFLSVELFVDGDGNGRCSADVPEAWLTVAQIVDSGDNFIHATFEHDRETDGPIDCVEFP